MSTYRNELTLECCVVSRVISELRAMPHHRQRQSTRCRDWPPSSPLTTREGAVPAGSLAGRAARGRLASGHCPLVTQPKRGQSRPRRKPATFSVPAGNGQILPNQPPPEVSSSSSCCFSKSALRFATEYACTVSREQQGSAELQLTAAHLANKQPNKYVA